VSLELNSIGSPRPGPPTATALVAYLEDAAGCPRRGQPAAPGDSNPLRILDSKNPATQALLDGAPALEDFLDEESARDFDSAAVRLLDAAGVAYRINPRLVRGLDYYNKTVFEWVTDALGAQGTVCAGRALRRPRRATRRARHARAWASPWASSACCSCSRRRPACPPPRRPGVFVIAIGDDGGTARGPGGQ
jgi:hypothetical protein